MYRLKDKQIGGTTIEEIFIAAGARGGEASAGHLGAAQPAGQAGD